VSLEMWHVTNEDSLTGGRKRGRSGPRSGLVSLEMQHTWRKVATREEEGELQVECMILGPCRYPTGRAWV
jgi:hypothetical protein